jgi:hypothetical protein
MARVEVRGRNTGDAEGTTRCLRCSAWISLRAWYAFARACATVLLSTKMQPHRIPVTIAIEHNPGPVIFIKGIARRNKCNPRSKI